MFLPNLGKHKKLPQEGKILPLSLQNFQSLIDKNWRFQKFQVEVEGRWTRRISLKDRPTSNPKWKREKLDSLFNSKVNKGGKESNCQNK